MTEGHAALALTRERFARNDRRQKSLPICVSVSAGLNFAIAMIGGLYYSSGAMAPEGQASAQVPQSMQTLGSIT